LSSATRRNRTVRNLFDDVLLTEIGSLDALRKHLQIRLQELDTKETNYVQLVGQPGWPQAKIQKELTGITAERAEIEGQLADTTTTKLATGRGFFLTAMELLRGPSEVLRPGRHQPQSSH
jgi:hypothetical protein